jgi:hypothetical protein
MSERGLGMGERNNRRQWNMEVGRRHKMFLSRAIYKSWTDRRILCTVSVGKINCQAACLLIIWTMNTCGYSFIYLSSGIAFCRVLLLHKNNHTYWEIYSTSTWSFSLRAPLTNPVLHHILHCNHRLRFMCESTHLAFCTFDAILCNWANRATSGKNCKLKNPDFKT